MNTIFIKIFFCFISFVIFEYILSYSRFEFKENKNVFGTIFLILFCLSSIVFGNAVFWNN